MSYLLDGPAYHIGAQNILATDPKHILAWNEIITLHLEKRDKHRMLTLLERELEGYVAVTDPPAQQLIPELMQLYPDAVVVCTTRDVSSWCKSMAVIAKLAKPVLFQFIFFFLGVLRHFPQNMRLLSRVYLEAYGVRADSDENCRVIWEKHEQWLREIVPPEKLFFVDVKDGWDSPLCRALGVPVPKDQEFPRLNDGKAVDEIFKGLFIQGMVRWAAVGAGVAVILAVVIAGLKALL